MIELTPRQEMIVEFVRRFWNEHGYAPSVRQVGDAVGLSSTSTVHVYLTQLVKMGVLASEPGTQRTLRLVRD